MTLSLNKSIYLKATPAQVWTWLTEPSKLAVWFHAPKSPLTKGAAYELFGTESGDRLVWGEILHADPPNQLEMTFTIGPLGGTVTHVTWRLQPVAGGTRLLLEHTGLPDTAESFGLALALDKGWDDHLASMRTGLDSAQSCT